MIDFFAPYINGQWEGHSRYHSNQYPYYHKILFFPLPQFIEIEKILYKLEDSKNKALLIIDSLLFLLFFILKGLLSHLFSSQLVLSNRQLLLLSFTYPLYHWVRCFSNIIQEDLKYWSLVSKSIIQIQITIPSLKDKHF